jgi:hypothetical protein
VPPVVAHPAKTNARINIPTNFIIVFIIQVPSFGVRRYPLASPGKPSHYPYRFIITENG